MTSISSLFSTFISRWLPYSIAGIGIIASIIWLVLMRSEALTLSLSIKDSLLWFGLILGVISTFFLVIISGLFLLMRRQIKTLLLNQQKSDEELLAHKQMIETQQKLEKNLLQGQKLQAIGTLAGGIAHDFNNIIYAIIGYVEMAREDIQQDTPTFNNLGKVLQAANQGKQLVARILTFSRRQHHDYTVLSLQDVIESALALLKPTIPSSVTIQFSPAQHPYLIKGDLTQLHQAIINIINNAVDALEGEGVITINMTIISKKEKSTYYKIEISDTGNGMDHAIIERIFEPFFTTKEVGKGTGLGLSTAHTIITEHHGEISANSQLGQGTTFTLLLPQYKEK